MYKFMSLLQDSEAAMDREAVACAVVALARQVARRCDVRSGKVLAKFLHFFRNIGLVGVIFLLTSQFSNCVQSIVIFIV